MALIATAAFCYGLVATPASAAPPTGGEAPLDRCTQAAVDRALSSWLCVGGMLEYTTPAQDSSIQPTVKRELRLFHDWGPALTFSNAMVRCTQLGAVPIGCGNHWADRQDGVIALGFSNYVGPVIQGNLLNNRANYQGSISYQFTPQGLPKYTAAPLYGQVFDCRQAGNCSFE